MKKIKKRKKTRCKALGSSSSPGKQIIQWQDRDKAEIRHGHDRDKKETRQGKDRDKIRLLEA